MRYFTHHKDKKFETKKMRQDASIKLISFIFETIGVQGDSFVNLYVGVDKIYAIAYKDKEKVSQRHNLIFWQRDIVDKKSLSKMKKNITKKIKKFID